MNSALFEYELPPNRIAQRPVTPRDSSKLLLCQSKGRLSRWDVPFHFSHHQFRDIADFLNPNDLLIMNDAKVLPVRLLGNRIDPQTGAKGGAVEALLMRRLGDREWVAIMHLSAQIKPGLQFLFEPGLIAESLSTHEERLQNQGEVRLAFSGLALERIALETWLERHGHVPLPPYIERQDQQEDKKAYQTVYASKIGSAAAPTAGFHFTPELLQTLRMKGVQTATVTLHVGIGTFRPIKSEKIEDHPMHEETYEISEEFARRFHEAKAEGKRIVAVGTTVVRALESWIDQGAKAGIFQTRAYFTPGFQFRAVDDLITNFHLPRSTLLVLVAAAMGLEATHEAYRLALANEYRFFSYGDAMFIRGAK